MAQDRDRILALQNRSFEFTCGVISAYPKNSRIDDASRLMWRQLIKAASSATFNLEEADAASSDNDFLAKMRIALLSLIFAKIIVNKRASMKRPRPNDPRD